MLSPNQSPTRDLSGASPQASGNWYVVEIHREKSGIALANLSQQGFGTFFPQMLSPVTRFGKTVRRLQPLFPGYCFVECSLIDRRWRAVNSTRGVKRFAGPPGLLPTPIRNSIVTVLMERCPDGVLNPTIGDLQIGQEVRLEDCAFAGALAKVHELDDKARVKVLISILGDERIVSVPRTSVLPNKLGHGS